VLKALDPHRFVLDLYWFSIEQPSVECTRVSSDEDLETRAAARVKDATRRVAASGATGQNQNHLYSASRDRHGGVGGSKQQGIARDRSERVRARLTEMGGGRDLAAIRHREEPVW